MMKRALFFGIVVLIGGAAIRERGGAAQPAPMCGLPTSGASLMIDAMESAASWQRFFGNGTRSALLASVPGCRDRAVQLNYDLGEARNAWAQLRRDFNPPLNLSAFDHLRLRYRGTARNTIEIGMVGSDDRIYFASSWPNATGLAECNVATWDLKGFRNGGQSLNMSQVKAIFISVLYSAEGVGGVGAFEVDELQALNIAGRATSESYAGLQPDLARAQLAAAWIAARQQAGGLLKSWQEEAADNAYLYDQALAVLVLTDTHRSRADQLVAKLIELQNADGSWNSNFRFLTGAKVGPASDIGPIAWAVYALARYHLKTGNAAALQAAKRGAAWIAGWQRADGSVATIAEWNLDAWWALQIAGRQAEADRLRNFLLTSLWDAQLGRFKSDREENQIFLDVQTWGAAFLRAIGRDQDARRALSYAQWTLATTTVSSRYGTVCGFDGAGPFGGWNEGMMQYVAARGENSQFYWGEVAKQQAADGGIPNSPRDTELRAYIVWLSPWHGIAPTAWFYFAATGSAFPAPLASVCAANYAGPQLAPDSIATAFGQDLAGGTVVAPSVPLPLELAGTRLTMRDGAGVTHDAPFFFVSPSQINYLVPAGAATGPAELRAMRGEVMATLGQIEVVRVSPGLFAADASGRGAPAGYVLRVGSNGTQRIEPIANFDSAQNRFVLVPIDLSAANEQVFLILFGTGCRLRSALSAISVAIGGAASEVLFAGPVPGLSGLDQINIRLSPALAGRGEVDLVMTVDGRQANVVRVHVR